MPASSKRSREVAFEDELELNTPAPSDISGDSGSPEPAKKRSRKPWGQPVEPFEKVIGPRKRAKTELEKEQRAKERILRNRKAADASRQRRKDEQDRLQRRIAELEADLEVYQNKFGPLSKQESSLSEDFNNEVRPYQPHISPQLLSQSGHSELPHGASFHLTPPDSTNGDTAFDAFQLQQTTIKQEQTLTSALPIDISTPDAVTEASYPTESVMTQYPAVSDSLSHGSSFLDISNFHFPVPTSADLDDLHEVMCFNPIEDAGQIDFFPDGLNNLDTTDERLQGLDNSLFSNSVALDFDQFLHDEADVSHQAPEPTAQPQPLYGAVS